MNRLTLTQSVFRVVTKIPITLSIGVIAIAIACVPSMGEVLQLDRAQIEAGEIWRLATGHLAHWNAEHLQWDLLMFVVLGSACEFRNPQQMRLCLVVAATSVSILVFSVFSGITAYRGLSGVDTALFTLLAIDLMYDARRQQNNLLRVAVGGLLLAFVAKTVYEAGTGQAFFVDQNSAGFELLVWDHVAAAIVGVVVAVGSGVMKGGTKSIKRNLIAYGAVVST